MILFFDIDDTLLDSEAAHYAAISKIIFDYSLNIIPDQVFREWLQITDMYLKLYFRNEITANQQRIIRIKKLWEIAGQQIADEDALVAYKNYHQYFKESCFLFPETIPTLEKLKNYKMGIISNGPVADQNYKLERNGLIHYFDPIIISEGVGISKPQKEIFELAAKQANEPLNECIFVGDSYELDYLGGADAGMKTILIDRTGSQTNLNCRSIRSLNEISDQLKLMVEN